MIRISTARPSLLRLGACPTWRRAYPGQAVKTVGFSRGAAKLTVRTGLKDHWNAESLRTTEKYPLSKQLREKVNPTTEEARERKDKSTYTKKRKTATSRHARNQIVSPDLCDDVLKYYGKSLEIHKGCDILDVNPGAGLWSQKLHDFLQPRSHVLMEPAYERFKTFLDPLLDAPGSTYKLVQKPTTHLDHFAELIAENVFPEQTRVDPEDTTGQDLNRTLLVTGMLAWDPVLPGLAFDSMAKQLYNLFSSAVRTNDYFHTYGRVRTLFWVSSADFETMFAKTSARFMKNNALLEMTQSMELVVDGPRAPRAIGKGAPGRSPQYEIESTVRAMQKARASGMSLPSHREDTMHKIAAEIEEISEGTGRVQYGWLHDFLLTKHKEGTTPTGLLSEQQFRHVDDLVALQAKYPDIDFEAMGNALDPQRKKVRSFWKGREDHPAREEAHSFSLTKSADRALIAKLQKLEDIADIGEEMYRKECAALRLTDGTPEKDALLKQIEDLDKQWESAISRVATNYKAYPFASLDDRISLRYPPYPRLQWDRREFEPLTMQPDEAWPPSRLLLISSTPYPRPPGQTADWYEWLHDFVYALYANPAASLPEALNKMQHGAAQIIDDCPALTDPDKGGRLQMKHLRVRLLTSEMVEQLVQAYRDWPFKEPGSDHNKYFRWKGLNAGQSGAV
ncbi:hypothetical protein E8E12_011582 [Didymella heteroderae]|uniref:Mitochondrial transcription factor 1 n=1 Tax=Didymella heteroderae TaxID=1769908 RepID=A0A9P4X168_9PLEO|nr:hypothetical protein E8E12_011582 [Didymella heteroderae]